MELKVFDFCLLHQVIIRCFSNDFIYKAKLNCKADSIQQEDFKVHEIICRYEVSALYYTMFQLTCDVLVLWIYYASYIDHNCGNAVSLHNAYRAHLLTCSEQINFFIMNFKIKSKLAETWNPTLLAIYEALPYPINEIIWKLEQLRTPKVFYYDLENEVRLVKVK